MLFTFIATVLRLMEALCARKSEAPRVSGHPFGAPCLLLDRRCVVPLRGRVASGPLAVTERVGRVYYDVCPFVRIVFESFSI